MKQFIEKQKERIHQRRAMRAIDAAIMNAGGPAMRDELIIIRQRMN